MANTRSAQKRNRQAEKRRARNTAVRTTVKNALKKAREAIATKDPAKMKDQWDIYDSLGTVPDPNVDLETIAPPKDGTCKIG